MLPTIAQRFTMGWRAISYTSFNLIIVVALSLAGLLPPYLFAPYLIQWLETMYGTLRPAMGVKPTRIGIRQLIVSTLFTVVFILIWLTTRHF